MMKIKLLLFSYLLFIVGCKKEIEADKQFLVDTLPDTVSIPINLDPYNYGAKNFQHKKNTYTIISLFGAGCNICVVELNAWKDFLEEGKLDSNLNYYFIAIGTPNFYFKENVLKRDNLSRLPIYVDEDSTFLKANNILNYNLYKTILLDNKGSVLHVGSPNYDQDNLNKIRELTK